MSRRKTLKELPVDRFCGKPVVYRAHEDGYDLYGLGPNGEDDQGKPRHLDGDDIPLPRPHSGE